ncbi:hypothetical protein [Enterococcus innesii]|uniref:hypothetical protein n=1 Tax=Enterococcus innesii TaxID=2839759 RepID=UPI002091DB43|nr:hypothetical protein [Enterococcus innesii]MCO5496166.1 hypothetical protein [Enterococcus innesii]
MLHIFGKDSSTSELRIFTGEFQQVFSENQNLVIHLLKGQLQLQFTDKKETLAAKDLLFMKANTSVSLKSTTNETYVLLYFVSTSLLNSVLDMTRDHLHISLCPNVPIWLECRKRREIQNKIMSERSCFQLLFFGTRYIT